MPTWRYWLRISRFPVLFLALLTYLLGAGIIQYLGRPIQWAGLLLGLLAILVLPVSAFWLVEYFRLPFTPLAKDETPRQRESLRTRLLLAAFGLMTVAAVAAVTLLLAHLLTLPAAVMLIVTAALLVAYAMPPIRLAETGYGELVLAILLGSLIPALAYLLQESGFNRLLTFATFPLTLLILAYLLVSDFPGFATDQKYERRTFLTRLTWQYAIPIHHVLVLAAFLVFAVSPSLGFPWRLDWPVFLVLPFALIQIFWLQRIGRGGRTLWSFLTALALATAGLTAYILAFSFWTR